MRIPFFFKKGKGGHGSSRIPGDSPGRKGNSLFGGLRKKGRGEGNAEPSQYLCTVEIRTLGAPGIRSDAKRVSKARLFSQTLGDGDVAYTPHYCFYTGLQ